MIEKKYGTTAKSNLYVLPCVAMRDIVLFPKMTLNFDVARKRSVIALREAIENGRRIFLTAQIDSTVEKPTAKDIYHVGVIAEIRQIIKTPDGVSRVLVDGICKARLGDLAEDDKNVLRATVKRLPNYSKERLSDNELEAVCRSLKKIFEEYASLVPRMSSEMITSVLGQSDPQRLFESIAFNIAMPVGCKQELLEAGAVSEKLGILVETLAREVEVLSLEHEIAEQVHEQMDKNQRDYFLREQMKAISSQLGEGEDTQSEALNYIEKIEKLSLDKESTDKLLLEANRLMKMPDSSQEASVIRNYLDTCIGLPWEERTKDKADINKASQILDDDHYGMKKVKERILELFAVRNLTPDIKGQIICLYGPPGVGKTSVGKSIARALGRKYVRVSLGGVRDESDIRGHRKTYIGSMPGRIINAVKQAGVKNPLILLDEIDKMSNDFRGDPSSAMLEVLDSEQNKAFRDHYIEIPFDLSEVLFITTANNLDTISPPLLDRMDVIELSSYTREEKLHIARDYLLPKQLKKHGLSGRAMRMTDDCIYSLIDSYTREAGVRKLERSIASLCRKCAKKIVSGECKRVTFTADNISEFLGARKYHKDIYSDKNDVGEVNGLAWTSVGGVIMPLEVLILDGKGTIELTGSLGDVMKESAKIAVSYARSVADKYGIDKDFFTKRDIHIHAPEGAVPKDGPSAGVTMATGIISALSGWAVRGDVAMTGEITLRGKVLAIGGLREKTMAAYKAGMKTVIVPKDNEADLEEVDDVVKNALEFVFAEKIQDVLDIALIEPSLPPITEEKLDLAFLSVKKELGSTPTAKCKSDKENGYEL